MKIRVSKPSPWRRSVLACALIGVATTLLWACASTDDEEVLAEDAGTFDGAPANDGRSPVPLDGGAGSLSCGDASGATPRVLLVQGKARGSELAALNLETLDVDGRLPFDGGYGVTSSLGSDPYLLGGESDVVTRLDAREPWKPVASWNVTGDDRGPSDEANANPVAVVPVSCDKAYVLRFNRDRIAIIDPSRPAGGAPIGYIDLGGLLQTGDPRSVEMTSAVYVPEKGRVYVLLGNADLTRTVTADGFTKLLCADTLVPSIIAIDVTTNTIVSLGGTAPGGGIALAGYNPPLGTPLVYDAVQSRLLVLNAGCNAALTDGGVGDILRRRVEQVDLATGAVKTLLPLEDRGFPSTLAFEDPDHAAIAFYFDGYLWNPRTAALGASVVGGVDLVATDGRGGFVGTRATFDVGGSVGPLEVLRFPKDDAGTTVVKRDPFSTPGGYVAGIEAWPHP